MKKITVILLLSLIAAAPSLAQKSEPFIQMGMNLSTVVGPDTDDGFKPGVNAGIMTDTFVSERLFIRFSILYSMKGAQTRDSYANEYYKGKHKYTLMVHYVEAPVSFGVKFPTSGRVSYSLHTGPYVAVGIDGKVKEKSVSMSNDGRVKSKTSKGAFDEKVLRRPDMGWNFGAGISTRAIYLGLQYGQGVYPLMKKTGAFTGNLSLNLGIYI
ncbi:MAG: PorT family protein [Alistipes sp.]|nr:PorT family protein [Alistipes sp.]